MNYPKTFIAFAGLWACLTLTACGGKEPPPRAEDTPIGSQLAPLTKARQFSSDYDKALEKKRKELDKAIDDGGH